MDPVDPYSGDYYYAEEDLTIPGLIPLKVVRSYTSSRNTFTGPFGIGTYLAAYNYAITVPTNPNGTVNTSANQEVLVDEGSGLTTAFSNGSGGGLVFTNNEALGTAGSTIMLTLDGTNHLSSAIYETPDKVKFHFDDNGWLTETENESGVSVDITRDSAGKLLTVSSLGRSLTFTYNANNLIKDVTDHTGRVVTYSYDSSNRLGVVLDPLKNAYSYTWNDDDRIQAAMDWLGKARILNSYQDNGMIKQQSVILTALISGEYRLDATGPLERRITDPNGNTRTLTYDSHGLLIEEEDGLGHSTTYTYSASLFNGSSTGRYIEKTDALNHTTRVDLNTNNLPTTITDADNKTYTITYDSNWPAKPATITDPLNHTTTFTYDSTTGDLEEITDADNNVTAITYNSLGLPLTRTNALNKTTTYTYNSYGDLTSITDPLSRTTSLGYNTLGLLTSITDPKSQVTEYTYNAKNWLTQIKDPLNKLTKYTYDGNGWVTQYTDQNNHAISYQYDLNGRLSRIAQGSLYTYFTYDKADRLTQVKDPKNQTLNYTYDAANRLTQEQVKIGTTTESTYTYTYDDADRLLSIGDGTDTWSFTYDTVNRVTQAVGPQGTIDYDYDDASRKIQMAVTGQTAVDYTYDVLNRLTDITQGLQSYGYAYDDIGRRTDLTRPNGVSTSYTYDDANQLTQIHHLKTGILDEQHDYTYDNNGNILTVGHDGGTLTYTYDALDRVTQMVKTVAIPGVTMPKQIDWTYDNEGNITQRIDTADNNTTTTYSYTYNTLDRLTSQTSPTSITYTYDNNGNLTSDTNGRSFTWNAQDQLTQLTVGGVSTSFAYDPLGRRKSLTQGGTTENYLYDGLDLVHDDTNWFLFGAGIDEPLQMDTSGTLRSYLADHLGSVTRLTDNTGSGVAQYYYGTYGAQLTGSSPLAANPFTYTAREDDGTGLYYYRARYYDPSLEVFISQDPLNNGQRYVAGNPLKYTDSLGLEAGYRYVPASQVNPSDPYTIPVDDRPLSPQEVKCNRQCAPVALGIPISAGTALVGQDFIPKPRVGVGGGGTTPNTSLASMLFRKVFPQALPWGRAMGTKTWGGMLGRITPYAGYAGIPLSVYLYANCYEECSNEPCKR